MTTMPSAVFAPEQLTINSVDTLGPAWLWLDLANLWIPTSTWQNRIASGAVGSNPLPGIQDELITSLPFWVWGRCDWEGTPYADEQTGFRRNWRYLCNHLFLPPNAGYYTAVYQSPDADEDPITFPIQVRKPSITERYPTIWTGQVEVCLPDGALV